MLLYTTDIILPNQNRILAFDGPAAVAASEWPESDRELIAACLAQKIRLIRLRQADHTEVIVMPPEGKSRPALDEEWRNIGFELHELACREKWQEAVLTDHTGERNAAGLIAEGMLLSNYQFLKYFSKPDEKRHSFNRLGVLGMDPARVRELQAVTYAVGVTRDLVNEPASFLTAPQLSEELVRLGRESGLSVEVLDRNQIESLRMGGLLAVNRGSIDPPQFIILGWEPESPVNAEPLVLVGKGIMFDTGGLSLKPTPGSMDEMKSDMAGAAAVAGAMIAMARLNLPVKTVGLIPATDNRPDGNAYAPGDVIRMFDQTTVEVLNCDAEGRLILADALAYAKKYSPGLVIDLATLTGSAQVALGSQAAAVMGTAPDEVFTELFEAGFAVHERLVRFPVWEEYGKLLESEIADVKNIGGRYAGAITAGKFLERFTSYPWVHIDIAGTAFLLTRESYRGIGGTGTGVRLLTEFIRKHYQL